MSKEDKRGIEKIMVSLDKVQTKDIIPAVLEMHGEIVQSTPVDTGWARNNWNAAIGKIIRSTIGSKESVTPEALNNAISQITKWKPYNQILWIVNNVPYIGYLNDGHSSQAPRMFVQKAIQRVLNKFNRRKLN